MQSRGSVSKLGAALALALALACGGGPKGNDGAGARMSARVYAGRPAQPPVQLAVHRTPRVFPPDTARVKPVHLQVTNTLVDLGKEANGGKVAGWSFGGQIPGPTVRVRQGDRVRLSLTNNTDGIIEGLALDSGPRSITFGGMLVDRQDAERTVKPGETLELELTAMTPGVHLYHGGTPGTVEAIAAGMYGMLIVDPLTPETNRPDREYAVVQGEVYARLDPAGRRVGTAPIQVLDREALSAKRPSHLGYAGHFDPAAAARFEAKPGERVRLYLLNAGLNTTGRR